MFCPKCATQNIEGAHFCRVCGANISLIPQALSGQLPQMTEESGRHSHRLRRGKPSLEDGIRQLATGFGFFADSWPVPDYPPPVTAGGSGLLLPPSPWLATAFSSLMPAKINRASLPTSQTP